MPFLRMMAIVQASWMTTQRMTILTASCHPPPCKANLLSFRRLHHRLHHRLRCQLPPSTSAQCHRCRSQSQRQMAPPCQVNLLSFRRLHHRLHRPPSQLPHKPPHCR